MKLFNTLINESTLKKLRQRALAIDSLKEEMASLTDEQLKEKTFYFQKQFENVADIKQERKILDKITNEAFAVCREAAKRVLGLFPFIVQIMGALVINDGDIAEMKTGEGKTLTATMAVYTNALTKKGVHVVTVNQYLASRDANWMGEVYRFLGLSVGVNNVNLSSIEKKEAYGCDITYTTNSELGFDYLRDNLVKKKEDKVQVKGLNFCIIDEADSILIDDAKTPLIISGGNSENMHLYIPCQNFVSNLLNEVDYISDVKTKTTYLTSNGIKKAQRYFNIENLYDIENQNILHCINNALKANYSMDKNVEYVVRNNAIEIVDENTGRILEGRSFSDGLHQAIEAKEKVKIKPETKTYASITYQNFFRLYNKVSGMTGTAKTEEEELIQTYNMKVIEIPTNKPIARIDLKDKVYGNLKSKYEAIVEEVVTRHKTGQPILVGTISVEKSYIIYDLLLKKGIKPELLNAVNDEREAEIIALAGQKDAVTIATNMAGRGTDIKLSDEAIKLGGLCVIGTERHDSKRIDNQLRGRSGRQGDVGVSMFFVSLQDNIVVKDDFTKPSKDKQKLNEINDKSVNFDRIQNRLETISFYSRKTILDYDNVLSLQRHTVYSLKDQILDCKDLFEVSSKYISVIVDDFVNNILDVNNDNKVELTNSYFNNNLMLNINFDKTIINSIDSNAKMKEYLNKSINLLFENKKEELGEQASNYLLNSIYLRTIDTNWPSQITAMDNLKAGAFYRQYANTNPLVTYKTEGFELFNNMFLNIAKQSIASYINIRPIINSNENKVTVKIENKSEDK